MKHIALASMIVVSCIWICATASPSAAGASTGTIVGHVRLSGPEPGNPIIRMGMDPMCASLNRGTRPVQAMVLRAADGGLANALVDLKGTFPASKPPAKPVEIDQQKCLYTPRVVGAQVGQALRIKNNDAVFHNVHSVSRAGNDFDFSQPTAGLMRDITLKGPEVMLHLKCDIHSWMTAYVAVETHPYFDVSAADGSFTLKNVPAGKHTVRVWHERYGELTRTVNVTAGGKATVDFTYTGKEHPSTARLQDLVIDEGSVAEVRGSAPLPWLQRAR